MIIYLDYWNCVSLLKSHSLSQLVFLLFFSFLIFHPFLFPRFTNRVRYVNLSMHRLPTTSKFPSCRSCASTLTNSQNRVNFLPPTHCRFLSFLALSILSFSLVKEIFLPPPFPLTADPFQDIYTSPFRAELGNLGFYCSLPP
ncbi:hypothetical protein P175DRAFT_095534 [Aspergillus ochraceoroseus IBT 24754]|uniref:Uncharacterized protein n=1 Tax=Aspergillus ochraceoroseus IBT 24754 TaxID=1392256 RepID=A0A2T5LMM0_9EURO|nr:uncharacterized protein P175DRAFT_095534 [Aspergillus ochraceoroseus IBT 24754]PTU17538.1 hypothetical protein P175DRAFT_095534 [Aspergillus ochraceoroseus IBT 24754]